MGDCLGERPLDCNCPEPHVHRPPCCVPTVMVTPHPQGPVSLRSPFTCGQREAETLEVGPCPAICQEAAFEHSDEVREHCAQWLEVPVGSLTALGSWGRVVIRHPPLCVQSAPAGCVLTATEEMGNAASEPEERTLCLSGWQRAEAFINSEP